jgi:hypothetical protein
MARTAEDIEQFDFDSLSDGQLRGLQSRIREIINRRVQSRLDEYRLMAREAGYQLSLFKPNFLLVTFPTSMQRIDIS